ncbi:tail fiber assembly protein [Morganella morganii]|uniref:tail fiber assembly protein n=1 Tax=Morganella morganii TaxID=582 RepID=UPI001FFC4A57|nr:tail fiber assembly protein [Morganella morganii]
MQTEVIEQKFFKDIDGKVRCIDIMLMNKDSWETEVSEGWVSISKKEADKITNPPPTKEQLIAQAEEKKQYLIAEVQTETQMLKIKLDLKRIKPAELELLNAWLDYLDLLEEVDTSTAPDIDWPVKPQ